MWSHRYSKVFCVIKRYTAHRNPFKIKMQTINSDFHGSHHQIQSIIKLAGSHRDTHIFILYRTKAEFSIDLNSRISTGDFYLKKKSIKILPRQHDNGKKKTSSTYFLHFALPRLPHCYCFLFRLQKLWGFVLFCQVLYH